MIQKAEDALLEKQKQDTTTDQAAFDRFSIIMILLMMVFIILLIISVRYYLHQNEEKQRHSEELITANKDLSIAEESLKGHIAGLEEMMFMTSHKVRHPITNILGLSTLLHQSVNSPDELNEIVGHIQDSAVILDTFTKELTNFMGEISKKRLE
jgi:signal transduction histidine kinase